MDTTERLHFHFSLSCIGEGNSNPLQCSCLENPKDEGVWWVAIYGVAQSQTRLKRLSSRCSSCLPLTGSFLITLDPLLKSRIIHPPTFPAPRISRSLTISANAFLPYRYHIHRFQRLEHELFIWEVWGGGHYLAYHSKIWAKILFSKVISFY